MTTNNSKPLLIVLSFISIVLFAVLVLGVFSIRVTNKETSELLNLADQAAEMEASAQSIRTIQNEAAEDLAAFDNFVLTNDKLVPLIESIENAGRALGLRTSILSVGKIEDKKSPRPYLVRITIETRGPWTSTFSFLRAVENLPHRVLIDETSFFEEEDGWRSRIVLSLYSFD